MYKKFDCSLSNRNKTQPKNSQSCADSKIAGNSEGFSRIFKVDRDMMPLTLQANSRISSESMPASRIRVSIRIPMKMCRRMKFTKPKFNSISECFYFNILMTYLSYLFQEARKKILTAPSWRFRVGSAKIRRDI